mgnify:CR=1 FL=1
MDIKYTDAGILLSPLRTLNGGMFFTTEREPKSDWVDGPYMLLWHEPERLLSLVWDYTHDRKVTMSPDLKIYPMPVSAIELHVANHMSGRRLEQDRRKEARLLSDAQT